MRRFDDYRKQIEAIDAQMAKLFEARMQVCAQIGAYKQEAELPIKDEVREQANIERGCGYITDAALRPYYRAFQKNVMALSCRLQEEAKRDPNTATVFSAEETSYEITLAKGALAQAGKYFSLQGKVLLVADEGIPAAYIEAAAQQCQAPFVHILPQGMEAKSTASLEKLLTVMQEAYFTRGDCVVAVGGGSVCDAAGLAAALYMRGIDFYMIPTTLLSQADAAIGGKTAIHFHGIKNTVGAFYPPKGVLIDPALLVTLDERQLHAGLAEIIKIACTLDAPLFAKIQNSTDLTEDLDDILRRAVLLKKEIVEQDPKEQGLRRVLNFGHTIGHAIESVMHGKLLHGECVALGMLPMCGAEVCQALRSVYQKYKLPTACAMDTEAAAKAILHDKKAENGSISVITVPQIGQYEIQKLRPEEIRGRLRFYESTNR